MVRFWSTARPGGRRWHCRDQVDGYLEVTGLNRYQIFNHIQANKSDEAEKIHRVCAIFREPVQRADRLKKTTTGFSAARFRLGESASTIMSMSRDEILEIVVEHQRWLRQPGKGSRADFINANLKNTQLEGVNLESGKLAGANLACSKLSGINLSKANLFNANLRFCDLIGANLSSADLRGAKLRESDLTDADLRGADMREGTQTNYEEGRIEGIETELLMCTLDHAILRNANLSHVKLHRASIQGADLSNAVLVGAKLKKVNFKNSDLTSVDLSDADLSDANLTCCNLEGADLRSADLTGVNLTNANIDNANFGGSDLAVVIRDHPDELDRPADYPHLPSVREIFRRHAAWVSSGGQEGARAILDRRDLSDSIFRTSTLAARVCAGLI